MELIKIRKKNLLGLISFIIAFAFSLQAFTNTSYEFEINGGDYQGFILKLKKLTCPGGVDFLVIIEENGKIIYKKSFTSDSILKLKVNGGKHLHCDYF